MTHKVKNLTLAILAAFMAIVLALSVGLTFRGVRAAEAECTNTGVHIEGFDKTTDSKVWDLHTNPSNGLTEEPAEIKQGDGAFKTVGQGISDWAWQLAAPVDISGCDSVTFWLYLENADNFNNMADGQLVLSDRSVVDTGKIYWSLKNRNFVDGWQKVTFMFADATKEGAEVDMTKISHCRIYFTGLAEVSTAIFDDLHANNTQGLQLEGFNQGNNATTHITTDPNQIKEGDGAYIEEGGGFTNSPFPLETPVDISNYDALAFWLYLENADGFNNMTADNQLQISDIVLDENNTGIDSAKMYWKLAGRGFVDGWNYVVLPFDTATKEGRAIDLTKISSMRLYCNGMVITDGLVLSIFDDIRAIETQFIAEESDPIESYTVTDGESIINGVFGGLDLAYSNQKQGAAYLAGSVSGAQDLTAQFGPVDSALTKSGENELGLSFWLYVDKAAFVSSASVALSSSATVGSFQLSWTLSDLQDGWNWIAVKASEATETNVVDMSNLSRITVSLNTSAETAVGLDRVRIYNTMLVADWKEEPVGEAVTLDPVERVVVSSLDATSDTVFSNATVEIADHKEGTGAAILSGTGDKTITGLSLGNTDLLANNYNATNEFGITMWLYIPEGFAYDSFTIAMGSSAFGSEGYATSGSINFTVDVADLEAGWNWLVLKASDADSIASDINTNSLNWLLIRANGESETEQQYKVDRISVINATVAESIAQPPESEKIVRDPISGKIIIDCDTSSPTLFSGNTVDTSDKRQGKGSIRTEGAGFQLEAKYLNIGKTDLTKETLVLAMWIYIEDPTIYTNVNMNGQIELSSSNTYDQQEISWEVGPGKTLDLSTFAEGWNWIVLKGSDAGITGGSPDYDNLNYFRLYINAIDLTSFKMDRVTLTNVADTESYAEPDWRSEIFGGGGDDNFSGSNGILADGSVYLETPVTGDPFDTTITTTEEVTTGGCSSQVNGTAFAIAAVVLAGVCVLFVSIRKRRD